MGWRPKRWLRLGGPRRDVDDELTFHFTSVVEELMREGRTRDEAEAEARERFGDVSRYRRELTRIDRETELSRGRRARLDAAAQTLRSALRGIRRSPGLSLGVVLAFALGIGANTTMFGIVNRLLLSPPSHIENPGEVHRILIGRSFAGRAFRANTLSVPDYEELLQTPQFAGVAAYSSANRHVVGRGATGRSVLDVSVSGNYWAVLGVKPAVGRLFTPEEDRPGGDRVAVLGWTLYQSLFEGSPTAIGSRIDFGFGEYTVIGVVPRGFTGVDLGEIDLFLPLQVGGRDVMGERWFGPTYAWIRIVARLAPGATIASAEAAATPVHRRGREQQIASGGYDANARVIAAPLIAARDPQGPREAKVAAWLAGVSAIVLLIACVNVANLLLARSIRQRRELAIRLAMGVSRSRLIAQAMTESLVLALAGGVAAILIARWGGEIVRTLLLPNVAWTNKGTTGATVVFTLALSALTGVIAAILPAIRSLRGDLASVLRATSGGITRSTGRIRSILSMAQAALSVVLLIGAGLFVRSLRHAQSMDLGFDLNELLAATPVADGSGMTPDEMARFYAQAVERVERLPGVVSAASSLGVPFWTSWSVNVRVPGQDSIPTPPSGGPYVTAVSAAYMRTMDIQVVRGRDLDESDFATPMVAVVNESMAKLAWRGADPIGSCMILDKPDAPCTTVVGVAEDTRRGSVFEEPNPQYYVPLTHPLFTLAPEMLFVRVTRIDAAMQDAIRTALLELEPRLRFVNVRPLARLADAEFRSSRLGATMFSVFGVLALVIAAIGLYSVLAFDVAQRTRELGLRSALGAGTPRLVGGVIGRALRITAAGLLAGGTIAILLAPRVRDLLHDTSPRDPATFLFVTVALLAVAVLAGGIPAWRAARVDPNIALRTE